MADCFLFLPLSIIGRGHGNWIRRIELPSNGCHKSDLHFKAVTKIRRLKFSSKPIVSLLSKGRKFIPKSNNGAAWKNTVVDDNARKKPAVDLPTPFATVAAAKITPATTGFFFAKDEYDLDVPMAGLSSIPETIEDIRQGMLVIVVDDEDRENEGNLIMVAASLVTPETTAFIFKHGTGIVCVSMKEEDLERLQLPLMVTQKENEEKLCSAFTVSVDAKFGTTTGVEMEQRLCGYLRQMIPNPKNSTALVMFSPLKYREGGILKRAGHAEASVDLAMLAGLDPVGVLSEIVDNDGLIVRLSKLRQFAEAENLKIVSIADLIRQSTLSFFIFEYLLTLEVRALIYPV